MKSVLNSVFTFVLLFAFGFDSFSQQIKNVELKASALVEDKKTDNYTIVIFMDGVKKDSIYNKKSRAVDISLESGKLYSIVFKKNNYLDKVVIVNTHIPSGLRELFEEPFELQIELSESASIKKDLTDYPVAVLTVNRKVKSLMASENYHKFTHE